jgi:prepilin peptidase dependent protein C
LHLLDEADNLRVEPTSGRMDMNQQKGFSLIEVLLSLVLVTTVTLALLQQHDQTNLLLNQLLLRTGASQFLDEVDEALVINADLIPTAPSTYRFKVQHQERGVLLQLEWFNHSIARLHHEIGS